MSYNMKAIIGKLNPTARNVLNDATNLANKNTHGSIELQHFLAQLADTDNTDATRIFHRFGINQSRLQSDLTASMDRLSRGMSSLALSEALMKALREAWAIGSIEFGSRHIRTGAVLLALASDQDLSQRL